MIDIDAWCAAHDVPTVIDGPEVFEGGEANGGDGFRVRCHPAVRMMVAMDAAPYRTIADARAELAEKAERAFAQIDAFRRRHPVLYRIAYAVAVVYDASSTAARRRASAVRSVMSR